MLIEMCVCCIKLGGYRLSDVFRWHWTIHTQDGVSSILELEEWCTLVLTSVLKWIIYKPPNRDILKSHNFNTLPRKTGVKEHGLIIWFGSWFTPALFTDPIVMQTARPMYVSVEYKIGSVLFKLAWIYFGNNKLIKKFHYLSIELWYYAKVMATTFQSVKYIIYYNHYSNKVEHFWGYFFKSLIRMTFLRRPHFKFYCFVVWKKEIVWIFFIADPAINDSISISYNLVSFANLMHKQLLNGLGRESSRFIISLFPVSEFVLFSDVMKSQVSEVDL